MASHESIDTMLSGVSTATSTFVEPSPSISLSNATGLLEPVNEQSPSEKSGTGKSLCILVGSGSSPALASAVSPRNDPVVVLTDIVVNLMPSAKMAYFADAPTPSHRRPSGGLLGSLFGARASSESVLGPVVVSEIRSSSFFSITNKRVLVRDGVGWSAKWSGTWTIPVPENKDNRLYIEVKISQPLSLGKSIAITSIDLEAILNSGGMCHRVNWPFGSIELSFEAPLHLRSLNSPDRCMDEVSKPKPNKLPASAIRNGKKKSTCGCFPAFRLFSFF